MNEATVNRFDRPGARHRFTAREVRVREVSHPAAGFVRVTFEGPDLADFVSSGPADHVRLFFPHPVTGVLLAPSAVGPGEDGIVRPEGELFSRDFTPLNVRPDGDSRVFDVDFLRHENPGPAAAWAEGAQVGDRLVAVGPRGSRGVPVGATELICVVDGSALPAASRWITETPEATACWVVIDCPPEDLGWAEHYVREAAGRDIHLVVAGGALDDAVRGLTIGEGTFVFGAGEASRLVPLRRYLKHELGLPREQFALSGYWKAGQVGFDHHSPIDPEDPED